MPQCLLDFVTHVVGYKALLSRWAEGDHTERRSTIGWPPEFDFYVERSYRSLKAEQTRLLHNALWRAWHRVERAQKREVSNRDRKCDQPTPSIAGFSDVTRATALVSRASCGRAPF